MCCATKVKKLQQWISHISNMWLKKICYLYVKIFMKVIFLKNYKFCVKKSGFMYYASDHFFTHALGIHLHNFYK